MMQTASQAILAQLASGENANSELASAPDRITYAEAASLVERINERLASAGLEAGDCILVEMPGNLAGALLVLALTDSAISYLPLPPLGVEARAADGLPGFCRARIVVPPVVPDARSLDAWLRLELQPVDARPSRAGQALLPATYRRTSGSLGVPKLVAMPYAHELANARGIMRSLGFAREDRLSMPVPIFHTFGAEMLLGAISVGMSVDLQPQSNLLKLLERESEWNPSVAVLSPLHCEWLARIRRRPRPYRFTVTGGDRIALSTAQRYEALHGPLLVAYGSTETGGVAYSRPHDSPELRLSSVIYPRPGVRFRVESSEDLIDGDAGRGAGVLWISNPNAFRGYVDLAGHPLAGAPSQDEAWYRSGDLASLAPDGEGVQVLGRWDLSINRDGLLLPLADVESRARQIPEVSEAVAVPGADTGRGRELILFCTLTAGCQATAYDIRSACAARLPHYAVPDSIRIIDSMPRLPAGKPDRRALARLLNHDR